MAFNEGALGRDDLTVGDYAKTPAWDTLKTTFKAGFPNEPTQVEPDFQLRISDCMRCGVLCSAISS